MSQILKIIVDNSKLCDKILLINLKQWRGIKMKVVKDLYVANLYNYYYSNYYYYYFCTKKLHIPLRGITT